MDETPSFRNEFNDGVGSFIQGGTVVVNQVPRQVVPRDLCYKPRHWINHRNEIDRFCSVLDSNDPTPILLVGAPGIGKKSLAAVVALAMGSAYPDVVLRFKIGQSGADDAMREGLERSGLTGLPSDSGALEDRYRSYFARRRIIVVLEGARNLNDVKRFWPQAPQVAYVVLASRRLRWREADMFELPPLDRDNARELLTAAEQTTADDADRLFDAYGGNPGLLLNAAAAFAGGAVSIERLVELAGRGNARHLFLDRYSSVSEGAQRIYDSLHLMPQRTFEQTLLDFLDELYDDRPTVELKELRLLDQVGEQLWSLMTKPIEPATGDEL